mgnify:CR=1 FL=1
MGFETIEVSKEDGVATITLNRPERLNAWTHQMGGELQQALNEGNEANDVGAFVVTGAGRGFCAGADVKDLFKAQADSGQVREGSSESGNWVDLVRRSKPIVAAVNGAAIGVGLTQILPMDFILAARGAKLSCRFIKMGLVPELASSHFLVARCGLGLASELMLSGKTVSAEEAQRIGLVDQVVESEQLLSEATEVARSMGENPQVALQMVKELITQNMTEEDLTEVQRREGKALSECYKSAEHREAIAAFLEKREPDFLKARATD